MDFGYVRVSSAGQSYESQVESLLRLGIEQGNIYADKQSGATMDRDGFSDLLRVLREGDTLTVVALDRMGRSLSSMVKVMEDLISKGVTIRSLREGIDMTTPAGKFQAHVFMAFAELERQLIRERCQAGREAAIAKGTLRLGRLPALDDRQVEAMHALVKGGATIHEIQAAFPGVSKSSLYKYRQLALSGQARAWQPKAGGAPRSAVHVARFSPSWTCSSPKCRTASSTTCSARGGAERRPSVTSTSW